MANGATATDRPANRGAWSSRRLLSAALGVAGFGVLGVLGIFGGCASDPGGPAALRVLGDRYAVAFDAACDAARAEGLVPEMVDRRAGMIETAPRLGGSLVEPWTWGEGTAEDIVAGTFGFERRRARFEFVPAGFRASGLESTAPLVGPILPGSERGVGADIEGYAAGGDSSGDDASGPGIDPRGALELRVSVSVERRFRPGYQGPAYTRSLGGFWRDTTAADDGSLPRDRSLWTPVARDERLERALLERVRVALEGADAEQDARDAQAMRGSTKR